MRDAGAPDRERIYLDLVSRYQTAILNYLYRLVGDGDQAEDLTQETFLKAYRALGQLETGADAEARRRAWLYRIAHNAATDHLRRARRLRWLSLDDVRGLGGGDPAEPVAARLPVGAALSALPEEHRAVLHLFAQAAPGCLFWLGAATPGEPRRLHHHPRFDIDERCLPLGTALLAEVSLRYLAQQDRGA